jgi:hypothetical protein
MTRKWWILCCAIAGAAWSGTVLDVGFDADPLGRYSYDSCKAEFPGVTWNNGLTPDSASRVQVVQGGDTALSGRSLRVLYPAGCLGPSGTGGAPACGAQWRSYLPVSRDTLWLRYQVYFPDGFEWTKGGKLPGLCGSQCNTGGNVPTGTDGWSARMMWRDSSRLVLYLYYAGQGGTYGTDVVFHEATGSVLRVATGRWHDLVLKVSLNTPGASGGPGASDGRVQAWFDGARAADTAGFRFRDLDTMHVNEFYFSTFFGGSTPDFSPAHDNRIFFDGFRISTDSAGLFGTSGTAPRRPRGVRPPRVSGGAIDWTLDPGGWCAEVRGASGARLASGCGSGRELSLGIPSGRFEPVAWTIRSKQESWSGISILR